MSKDINVFTDGSTLNNQKVGKRKGGVGVFFADNDPRNISLPLEEKGNQKVTNQVAELLGCILAIETLIKTQKIGTKKINIFTDSMYIVNIINTWGKNWEKNNWKKSDGKNVDNLDLVKRLFYLSTNIKTKFTHVKSHQKEPSKSDPEYYIWYGNSKADELAVNASKSIL